MDQDEAAVERVHTDDVRSLVESLQSGEVETADSVRLIFRYEGDEHDVVHVRDDVDAAYTDAELRQRMETLAMKGLGDPPRESSLHEFGDLQATVRWFEDGVCAHFPDEEWGGVVAVFDRVETPLVEVALDHLD